MENQTIQVLGSGCPTCKQLLKTVKKIVSELNIKADVEYTVDVAKMIEMGIMTSPVLVINGKPVLTGGGYSDEEIKDALSDNLPPEKNDSYNSCRYCCKDC